MQNLFVDLQHLIAQRSSDWQSEERTPDCQSGVQGVQSGAQRSD